VYLKKIINEKCTDEELNSNFYNLFIKMTISRICRTESEREPRTESCTTVQSGEIWGNIELAGHVAAVDPDRKRCSVISS
jgi:hypothetical protein